MARYRLRFLLQEFDLPRGVTLIGRSSDCHVTIEDPLVSRQHARIVIDDDGPKVEDLGSRNGIKVNGTLARGFTKLKDGDRLRIGTQELVFCTVGALATTPTTAKTTGFLRYCASCRLPYPQELAACPSCGATEQVDEEALNGPSADATQNAWGVQLLIEMMDKALRVGRIADAVRAVQRAKTQLEETLPTGMTIEPDKVHALATSTLNVAQAAEEPQWACWVAHLYGQLQLAPSDPVLALLAELSTRWPAELAPPLADLLAALRERERADLSPYELDASRLAVARLEVLLRTPGVSEVADPREDTNPAIS